MTDLPYPPFSGDDTTCPKCGDSMSSRYQTAGTVFVPPDMMRFAEGPEWLLRQCNGCDYQWPEMCRDAYPQTAMRND